MIYIEATENGQLALEVTDGFVDNREKYGGHRKHNSVIATFKFQNRPK